MCLSWLPGEVWSLVFGHLSLSDRLSVRASCKYFRDLLDDSNLMSGWTVTLRGDHDEDFWRMVRRWRVTGANSNCRCSWTRLAKELPEVTSLTVNKDFPDLLDFSSFTNLESVYLTSTDIKGILDLDELLTLPQRVRFLWGCYSDRIFNLPTEIPPDSPFRRLRSFTFHTLFDHHPIDCLHHFLSSLPQLEHLSLSMYTNKYRESISNLPPLPHSSLTSLELVYCRLKNLPWDLMEMLSTLPFLRSLAIFCITEKMAYFNDETMKLSMWLMDLPALTSLVVYHSKGGFIGAVPSSVTRLTLVLRDVNSLELPVPLPNVRHLHLEQKDNCLGIKTAIIPELFAGLRTLRLSLWKVPEDVILGLASLKELEVLETMCWNCYDIQTHASISKLCEMTDNRLVLRKAPERRRRPGICGCACDIPTTYWV